MLAIWQLLSTGPRRPQSGRSHWCPSPHGGSLPGSTRPQCSRRRPDWYSPGRYRTAWMTRWHSGSLDNGTPPSRPVYPTRHRRRSPTRHCSTPQLGPLKECFHPRDVSLWTMTSETIVDVNHKQPVRNVQSFLACRNLGVVLSVILVG